MRELTRESWAAQYLQQWPQFDQVLVVARSLSIARGFVQSSGSDADIMVATFNQSLMGSRFGRIIVLKPKGGFRYDESQYVNEQLILKLPPNKKVEIIE